MTCRFSGIGTPTDDSKRKTRTTRQRPSLRVPRRCPAVFHVQQDGMRANHSWPRIVRCCFCGDLLLNLLPYLATRTPSSVCIHCLLHSATRVWSVRSIRRTRFVQQWTAARRSAELLVRCNRRTSWYTSTFAVGTWVLYPRGGFSFCLSFLSNCRANSATIQFTDIQLVW